jgi:hypothetical protein
MFFYCRYVGDVHKLGTSLLRIKFNVMGLTSCTSNALDVYSGGAQFEYWQRFRLT